VKRVDRDDDVAEPRHGTEVGRKHTGSGMQVPSLSKWAWPWIEELPADLTGATNSSILIFLD
jgi:hypothetical protein